MLRRAAQLLFLVSLLVGLTAVASAAPRVGQRPGDATPTPIPNDDFSFSDAPGPELAPPVEAPDCGPDLVPFTPSGWSFPVIPNSIKETVVADTTLFTRKPTYFDMVTSNIGTEPVTVGFYVDVLLDNTQIIRASMLNMPVGDWGWHKDWLYTVNQAGSHTVKMVIDPTNTVAECDETNNTWTRAFTWEPVDAWWGEYFNNMDLAGDPVLVRDEFIEFEWPGSPGPRVNADAFSVRWTRVFTLNATTYRFTLTRDNGMRFYFDDNLVYDEWTDTVDQDVFIMDIVPGEHTMRVEMFESGGTATAWFERRPCFAVTKSSVPAAGGSVSVSPPPDCNDKYVNAQNVELTANPAAGYVFSHWSGDVSGTQNPLTLAMLSPTSVTANFTQQTCYTLTTTVSPAGSGTVNASPAPNCAGGKYTAGTVVSLTAGPNSGYTFANWSVDLSGTQNPKNVTVNANKSVTANFTLVQTYTITTSANPTGGGSVTLTPNKASYQAGEQVQVQAGANSGYHFANWSGDLGGSTNPATVTMNGNKTIVANFTQDCYSLNLTVNPAGVGAIHPSPPPNCGSQYAAGTVVSLTAVGSAGWAFTNWSGNLSGTQNPNSVTMNSNRNVTAQFDEVTVSCYALTLDHTGQGTDPQGAPPQSAGCAVGSYEAGATVQLTSDPANGWHVAGWRGTANNGATTLGNSLVMPAAAHIAWVDYAADTPTGQRVALPMVLFGTPYGYLNDLESEPNDDWDQGNGPLLHNRDYWGYPDDRADWYYYDVLGTRNVVISLDDITGADPQLTLYYQAGNPEDRVDYSPNPPYMISHLSPPGRYYVRVYVNGDFNTMTQYQLRISAP